LWKRIIAAWVCATARFSSLRGSGTIARRLAFALEPAPRGRSKPVLGGGDGRAEHDRRLVEREVVVEELAEVGEARRDLRRAAAARGHQHAELAAVGLAELAARALRAHAREAERRRRGGARDDAAVAALCEQALTDDEVAFGAMLVHER
jgi:hypothetical protein